MPLHGTGAALCTVQHLSTAGAAPGDAGLPGMPLRPVRTFVYSAAAVHHAAAGLRSAERVRAMYLSIISSAPALDDRPQVDSLIRRARVAGALDEMDRAPAFDRGFRGDASGLGLGRHAKVCGACND